MEIKSQLIAKIAAHDRRTDHVLFDTKDLRMIWENGQRSSADRNSAARGKQSNDVRAPFTLYGFFLLTRTIPLD